MDSVSAIKRHKSTFSRLKYQSGVREQ